MARSSLFFLPLLLAACAAPDPSQVAVTMMGTKGAGDVNQMSVRAGDTLDTISRTSGLDIAQLLTMNGLVPQQQLTPGQRLKLPVPDEIKVIEGDTIDTIARAFALERNDIARLNNLKPPFAIARGQMLKLPETSAIVASTVPVIKEEIAIVTPPSGPIADATIKTTNTASGAKRHSSASGVITEEELAPPPGALTATAPSPVHKKATPATAPAQQQIASLPPARPVQSLGAGVPNFSWPLNGSILSSYGPKPGGRHNDGLDIGAPLGSTVRTAAPGEVVYTGNKVAGFGNLILIRHSGGFATAYGHVQAPLVKRGDRVGAGQAIAQVGKTGNVKAPQLHFEIRKGTTAVNPKSYLP